jgi:serine/threonine protein phosphatase PrpC
VKCKVIFEISKGWRRSMEDAAICQLDIGNGNSLFGVFDGHGGINYINLGP